MPDAVNGTEPLVSIICTAYNQEKYIRNCLDGFLMQKTDFPYEIIVHDDASTDQTAEIIREYERKHPECIRAIYQTTNQYSQGIRIVQTFIYPKTRGKFIAYCEGDDYWTDPLKLEKQVTALYAHPDCRLCLHRVEDVSEDGRPIGITCPKEHLTTGGMDSEQFIGKNSDFFHFSFGILCSFSPHFRCLSCFEQLLVFSCYIKQHHTTEPFGFRLPSGGHFPSVRHFLFRPEIQ